MPKITYSGSQAAFLDGIQVGQGQTVQVSASDLTRIAKGKAFKSLVEKGELEVQEIPDEEPKVVVKPVAVVVKAVNKTMQPVTPLRQQMKLLWQP